MLRRIAVKGEGSKGDGAGYGSLPRRSRRIVVLCKVSLFRLRLAMTVLLMELVGLTGLRRKFAGMTVLVFTVIARCVEDVELYRYVAPKQSVV